MPFQKMSLCNKLYALGLHWGIPTVGAIANQFTELRFVECLERMDAVEGGGSLGMALTMVFYVAVEYFVGLRSNM